MSRQLFEEARKVLTQEAAVKLDPVGQEDKDIDNDGDADKTDSYLKKRRGAISAAIAKSKNESSLSDEDIAKLKDILGEQGVAEETSKGDIEEGATRPVEDPRDNLDRLHPEHPGNRGMGRSLKDKILQRTGRDVYGIGRAAAGMKPIHHYAKKPNLPEETVSEGRPYSASHRIGRYGSTRGSFGLGSSGLDLGGRREAPPAPKPTTPAPKPTEDKKKNEEVEQIDEISQELKARVQDARRGQFITQDLGYSPFPKGHVPPVSTATKNRLLQRVGGKGNELYAKNVLGSHLDKRSRGDLKAAESYEFEQEDFELIENLNFALPENPSYQDFIKAALTIAECNSFSELSEEDQQYIISEMEDAFRNNDLSFIAEAEALSDMNDTVQRLRKAGHRIEDMGKDYKGQPYYVYVDKGTGLRRKVTYKGNQKVTQNMGKAAPEDTNEA